MNNASPSSPPRRKVAIVGSGPAALMAADRLSTPELQVHLDVCIFEKRKSAGRKLLIAGSSGLNITNTEPVHCVLAKRTSSRGEHLDLRAITDAFDASAWISFIENELGIATFKGTSRRYFIEEMKAANLLATWTRRLLGRGVRFEFGHECTELSPARTLTFRRADGTERVDTFDAILFALGGASWEPSEKPLRWPSIFSQNAIALKPFVPSNVGYRVAWPEAFLKEAEGLPLKNIVMSIPVGAGRYGIDARAGDAMITAYGIEGTPVYFVGQTGTVHIDLRPDLTAAQIAAKLSAVRENLSPIRRVKKTLALSDAAFAFVFHFAPRAVLSAGDYAALAAWIKAAPLELGAPQPLDEAISSSGGICLEEVDQRLMLRKAPGVYAAGEMLDWDVPTGGFLIQTCAAQGAWAGNSIIGSLRARAVKAPAE